MAQYIVALTGGIGSGKSTVANAFVMLGVSLVDADIIAREVVQPDSPALCTIAQHFGSGILNTDGSLNRAMLRAYIFSNPLEKKWLNGLLHPLIQQQTEQQLCTASSPYALWVVPLLLENNLQLRANRVLVVDVKREFQIKRTLSRDGIRREQVENIISAQVSRPQRLACADDIIDNSGCLEELTNSVAILHRRYLALAKLATTYDTP